VTGPDMLIQLAERLQGLYDQVRAEQGEQAAAALIAWHPRHQAAREPLAALAAGRDARHRQAMAEWERRAPAREQGEQARRAADARRRAELGLRSGERIPLAASVLGAGRPGRPLIF
jgi:hypothetical protein